MIETGMTGKQEKKVLVKLYCDDYLQFSPIKYGFSILNYSVYMYAHIPVWYVWLVKKDKTYDPQNKMARAHQTFVLGGV